MNTVTQVTSSYSGTSAIYLNGRLIFGSYDDVTLDIRSEKDMFYGDLLETLMAEPEFRNFEFISASGMQPMRELGGWFEPSEFEEYWPENLKDVLPDPADAYFDTSAVDDDMVVLF